MSWLKDVIDSAKESDIQVQAEKQRLRRIFDQNNQLVLKLLHDASDLLWGRQGLVRKHRLFETKPAIGGYFLEPGGGYSAFRIGWYLKKSVDNNLESLEVHLCSNYFSILYSSSFRYGPSRTASTKKLEEDELKEGLLEILNWRVHYGRGGR